MKEAIIQSLMNVSREIGKSAKIKRITVRQYWYILINQSLVNFENVVLLQLCKASLPD